MITQEKVIPIKRSLVDEIRGQLTAIAAQATEQDRAQVNKLVTRATGAAYGGEICTITPATAALLFLFHNSHNREWQPGWTLELARRMKDGLWKQNSMTPGFYDTERFQSRPTELYSARKRLLNSLA